MTNRARIKRDGDICRAKALDPVCVPHPENPHHHRAGPGPYPQYPAARRWIWEWIQGGVDQMKGLSNVGAATRLQIRGCAFWPCSISHHPRITHSRYAPFNGRYCGNGRSQVTMLQGSHSGIGSVSNGNPAEASDPPKRHASGHEISERPTRRIEATVTRLNAPHIGPLGFQGRGTGDRIASDSLKKRDDMVSRVTSPCVFPPEPKGLFEPCPFSA